MNDLELKISLPEKVDPNVGKTLTDLSSAANEFAHTVSQSSQKVVDATLNGSAPLFSPWSALCHGVADIINEGCDFIADIIRKKRSQLYLANDVLKNLNDKEQNGEKIPERIEDTDTLFSIQEAASETLDKDFISFWAKLYTEEACKEGTVTKKAINLCKDLNKDIVSILENKIFPYCDNNGFYLGNENETLDEILIAEEYGFLKKCEVERKPKEKKFFILFYVGQYQIAVFPGYCYSTASIFSKMLTNTAISIRNCLKIKTNVDIKIISDSLIKYSKFWTINPEFSGKIIYPKEICDKFVLIENGIVKFPEKYTGKNAKELMREILSEIKFKD